MRRSILIIVLIFSLLVSLKIGFNIAFKNDKTLRLEAEENVELFQKEYNNNLLESVYEKTCKSFKNATSKEEFLAIMKGKKDVFGSFKNSDLLYSNVINSEVIVLNYRSTYVHYSLIEEYTYVKENKSRLCLKNFYIDDSGKRGEVIKL